MDMTMDIDMGEKGASVDLKLGWLLEGCDLVSQHRHRTARSVTSPSGSWNRRQKSSGPMRLSLSRLELLPLTYDAREGFRERLLILKTGAPRRPITDPGNFAGHEKVHMHRGCSVIAEIFRSAFSIA